jgi:diacylglycerol O-acyltransferase
LIGAGGDPRGPVVGIGGGGGLDPGGANVSPSARAGRLTRMQRMSPQDASFLHIETPDVHMHIGSLLVFQGPPPSGEEITAHVAGKLPLVPRYRQRALPVPLELGRPVWVDDPHFNLDYHVRQTAIPRPGSVEQLRRLVGRVMSQQLDHSKPLWEMWIVEGLEDDHWGIINKIHHSVVDGVSGTDLTTLLLDREPEPGPATPDDWHPEPVPSPARLAAGAIADRLTSPYEAIRGIRSAVLRPRRFLGTVATTARGSLALAGLARPGPTTSVTGPIGPHRRWTVARASLADCKTIRGALGGTVNDVVLTAVAGGFRELLAGRGELRDDLRLRCLVPVSVRRPGSQISYENRVSAMFAELPVGVDDPVQRHAEIREQMRGLKDSGQAVAGEVLTSLAGFAPPLLLALGTRAAARVPQRAVATVATNVPGPTSTYYWRGRRLLDLMPFVPLGGDVRIGCAIMSYAGTMSIGITGDLETTADLDLVPRGIEDTIARLLKAASGR